VSTPACADEPSTPEGVLLDGLFGEWSEAETLVDDPPDVPEGPVDVLSVQALDDPAWLYLALDVGNEVTLQALPGTLHLLFDVDAASSTGGTVFGMDGVDLVVDLSDMEGVVTREHGAGFALRAVDSGRASRPLPRGTLDLMAAPTWSAPRFELRLARSDRNGMATFGRRFRMSAVYAEGGEPLDETEVGSYTFRSTEGELPPADVGARLDRRPGTVRVVQWNVAVDMFTRHAEDFARILAVLDPDVVLLDELPRDVTDDRLRDFFALEPLDRLGAWGFSLGLTGGVQRAAVAARDRSIEVPGPLTSVPYSDGALAGLAQSVADEVMLGLLEREVERGISAAAAWVEVDGAWVLFVSADLQSGGWSGSPRDRLRTIQADVLRARIGETLLARPTPVVVGGDLNLVGSRAPLFALVRGLDIDGSDLAPIDAERLGERTYATWRNPSDRFTPGRLDFLLVSDVALEVVNSFVFATEDLDDATLEALGLERDVMGRISDHLVIVADLR
jgi:hypothetical protein